IRGASLRQLALDRRTPQAAKDTCSDVYGSTAHRIISAPAMVFRVRTDFDVVIIGAGLAGLTLARHLLLKTNKTILLLERRAHVPSPRQKVGESTVQLGAYYYSRVLDLEEHL